MLKTHESHFRNGTGMKNLPLLLWFAVATLPLLVVVAMILFLSY